MKKIAIIGGGASGLMAACHAAAAGNEVVLFEKQKKIGRKILITGNGRCNISNRYIEYSRYHGENPDFVKNIFGRFGLDQTLEFFLSIGLPVVEGKDGRLFPASLQASTVIDLFEYEVRRRGVEIHLHRRIDVIQKKGRAFELITAGHERYTCDSVILAAGSCAYSAVGSSKSGYGLAESLGHRLVECFPSLVPLNIVDKDIRILQGVKRDCRLSVIVDKKSKSSSEGELLFTSYGISGPVAMDISRMVAEEQRNSSNPEISVDFFPEYSEHDLNEQLSLLWSDDSKEAAFSLRGMIHSKIPPVVFKRAGIDIHKKLNILSKHEKRTIVHMLKDFRLVPGESRGFSEAVVAAGGISVSEVDPATMESKRVSGLFITGELLDIDGDSGGFNLQFAWSTGAIAGMSQK